MKYIFDNRQAQAQGAVKFIPTSVVEDKPFCCGRGCAGCENFGR